MGMLKIIVGNKADGAGAHVGVNFFERLPADQLGFFRYIEPFNLLFDIPAFFSLRTYDQKFETWNIVPEEGNGTHDRVQAAMGTDASDVADHPLVTILIYDVMINITGVETERGFILCI